MPQQTHDLSDRALIDLPEARRYVWRDENDAQRDDLLIDAIDDVSDAIWNHCEREFKDTTASDRSGSDGVGNGTTTFVAASGAFVAGDVGKRIRIDGARYTIATFTNGTTVVLDRVLATGTALAWDFGELRYLPVTSTGYVDFRPYDLLELATATLWADRADLTDEVLTAEQYQVTRQGGGTYFDMYVAAPAYGPLVEGFQTRIALRGWWGMAAVPPGVKLACKQWVKNIAENPGSYASHAMSGYSITPDVDTITIAPAGMPAAVRYRLEDFARGYTLR